MAVAVLAVGIGHELLPQSFQLARPGYFLGLLVVFLAVLVVGDPGRIDRPRSSLHLVTGVMITAITVVNAFAAARLVVGILRKSAFDSAGQLLLIGGVVWITNVIAFALWFWDVDRGGAAARATGIGQTSAAFVFPEMTLPEYAPEGWYPQYADYLVLSFNTALAFSPTDVSAVRRWAKLMMVAESLISLALAALVVARAINIL